MDRQTLGLVPAFAAPAEAAPADTAPAESAQAVAPVAAPAEPAQPVASIAAPAQTGDDWRLHDSGNNGPDDGRGDNWSDCDLGDGQAVVHDAGAYGDC